MHYSEINHKVEIQDHDEDLIDSPYGERPILATAFAPVDSGDVIVPVAQDNPEGYILALTQGQGLQLLVVLAKQLGIRNSMDVLHEFEN